MILYLPGWHSRPNFPDREPLTSHPSILKHTTFGWGRRTCQGAALSEHELLTACGGLAWAFHISCTDNRLPDGEMQVPGSRLESLVIVKPKGFGIKCTVRGGRGQVVERLYRKSWEGDILKASEAVGEDRRIR